MRDVGVMPQARPFNGENVVERAMVPAKPSNPVAITVVEPVVPASTVTLVEDAVNPKSWTV
jgi:hypothetical protein